MDIAGFAKVAPYLTHPLVLVGFVLMLAFGIHWQLMKSGLLRQVNQKDSGVIIRLFLRYGFWLALTLLLAGVGLSAWNSYMDKEKVQIQAVDAGKLAEKLLAPLQGELTAKNEQIKALTEAITALSKTGAPAASINAALQALEQGDTAKAQAIFAEVLRSKEAEGKQANKEAAAAARHLGALAFNGDTKAALAAYQKAVELDPDDADNWNWLGILLTRTGELTKAEKMHKKALAINNTSGCKEGTACVNINLGNVYLTRGELDKAEEMYRKSLEISEALGLKEATAKAIGNLGLVYKTRGELDKAEEMYRKSLEINEALGSKEGMAINYGNLGNVYKTRGELDKAEEMHRKSLALHEALGSKEGMARQYGNLGIVYQTRGELDKAEQLYKAALETSQSLGDKEGMALNYAGLGLVYETRGELDKAEEMYRKSLEISEALGLKEATASVYANLGNVYKTRGELGKAEELWKKSLNLYQTMQAICHPCAKMVQQSLDDLAQQRSGTSQ